MLLGEMLDGTAQTKKLGLLDRAGIDAFVIRPDEESLQIVVQCKGFEVPEYGARQHVQCREEIAKYRAVGPATPEYWLVINRPLKDRAMREELSADLAGLVATGKAGKAELLDREPMLSRLQELAVERITQWADQKRSDLFSYYDESLSFVQYIAGVPFNDVKADPVDFMYDVLKRFFDELPRDRTGKYRHAPAFIVTSGFGFGKTSTLHGLARTWITTGGRVLYVPAALLDALAFRHTAGLAEALLEFLVPEDVRLSELAYDVFRDSLRTTLAVSKGWLLMIDGLDESPWAFSANNLAALWGSIGDLGIPSVISARDELVEYRRAEFFSEPPVQIKRRMHQIGLNEWPMALILRFLELFAARRGGLEPEGFRALRELVAAQRYDEIYGDIPKRPLFLGMLAHDAWSEREPERKVHRLYGKYFRSKLHYDRRSMAAGGTARRPSAIIDALGLEEAIERLLHLMQEASERMLLSGECSIPEDLRATTMAHPEDIIAESDLIEIAERLSFRFTQIEDLTMHSLLQPAGRHPVTRERQLRFAHRSFQDWFLARAYAEHKRNGDRLYEGAKRFLVSINDDIASGGSLP